jgi:hypothetical protein
MPRLPVSPFERSRYIGSVTSVSPSEIRVNLPFATEISAAQYAGHAIARGQVGELVTVEGQGFAVLGRITEIRLPDHDRLSVEPEREDKGEIANPVGTIRLLGSIDLAIGKASRGIPEPPRVGEYVYVAHPDFIRHALDASASTSNRTVQLGYLSGSPDSDISMSAATIFGRHCAVLGSTGGGKSWTTARLVEEISRLKGKALLVDPTGEYHELEGAIHVHLGGRRINDKDTRTFVSFPHQHLSELDLFALWQPSSGVQAPKLRDALQSLKLLEIEPSLAEDGCLIKQQKEKKPINQALMRNDAKIRAAGAAYNIKRLSAQIVRECVNPSGQNYKFWGGAHEISINSCVSLCMRIENSVNSEHLKPIFSPDDYMSDVTEIINEFLKGNKAILRVSMQYMPFEHSARELVINALGRYLLSQAREGAFHDNPLVVVLDEAHQFLNKTVGDEVNKVQLDAFGLIAKEGRKYGLTSVLATQRPRDVPEDVLSQVGTLIVHRLINERDQSVVVNASGAIDGSMASFLPNLGEGEAIIVGSGTVMPLPVQMYAPTMRPSIQQGEGGSWMREPRVKAPDRTTE